jgi:hypothetical protein
VKGLRILTALAVLYTLAAMVIILRGVVIAAAWYMDLFYGEPWFKHLPPDQQSAVRTFIDGELGSAVWPLVVTNAFGLVLLWLVVWRGRRTT